ncbi:DNA-directed RNA polymerase subunit beta [Candidatus Uhrbacteria bacterium]|nr:DNA-directed RNA polymerase subunit beta [Candidatus Uhrbacteria bacterium]
MPNLQTPIFARQPLKENKPRFFGQAPENIELPDLIEIQKNSYRWFFDQGIKELLEEISPIKDFTGRDLELWFDDYYFDEPKFEEVTSRLKNVTFEAPLRVKARLTNKRTGETKTQEVYLGDVPLMTPRGTFVVNGVERTVVSQLIRSAGVFFTSEFLRGRRYFGAKLIPNRGAWLEFETDINNVIWVKIDRKRKVAATSLLKAFGYNRDEEIRALFTGVDTHTHLRFMDATLAKDVAKNTDDGLIEVYKRIRPGDLATVDNARSLIYAMFFNYDRYDLGKVGRYKFLQKFSPKGRAIDRASDIDSREARILKKEDVVAIICEIIRLNVTQEDPDDIDHLGNRRVRAVGELIQNRFRIGLTRMERIIRDRMSTMDIASLTPAKLINARPVMGAIREFFTSSQLSQFMDQTNPLAELEHKRRLSAMGPGGLSRERAGFDVRDVHPTHYGRICPIATPEGPNIGLVGHLASYTRINEYGFLETPYRKVVKETGPNGETRMRVTDEIVYLNAFTEEKATTAAMTTPTDQDNYIAVPRTEVRRFGQPATAPVEEIDYMDVSSKQIISIATALIPFLEHDDAVRALMGTNMQRQAVPCVKPEAPLVGTGVEARAAYDSGHLLISPCDGIVKEVDGAHLVVAEKNGKEHRLDLNKFVRSNASTCLNQIPIVKRGQNLRAGEVVADGPGMDKGELALGQNVLVTFLSWEGYNYEDAVIISERLMRSDRYSSIHIEHYTIDVRETKLGPEVVTNDIPNIAEEKLKNLDERGIVRIGASVASGDILVGKITPKGETELSAEERLLRAIFGEKARDVRDSSLYLEHGEHGKVIDIKLFSAEDGDKLPPGVTQSIQVSVADMRKLQVGDKMAGRHGNKGVISKVVPVEDMPFLPDGTPVDMVLSPLGVVSRMNLGQILETHFGLAANALGFRVVTPVLNGATESQIKTELSNAGFSSNGKVQLYDGKSGNAYDHLSTVGYIYMMKLVHMVEDKIHQRSIGPYSLITQQPLGGKAQFGGQRFGEMEVWALEAYGAAHTLQEILTIKSDDVTGRSRAYESIIKGELVQKRHIPEAFHVLVRELKGLGLDVELLKNGKPITSEKDNKPQPTKEKR